MTKKVMGPIERTIQYGEDANGNPVPAGVGAGGGMKMERQVKTVSVSVNTTGGNGAATGSAVSAAVYGGLLYVYLNYHASAPASTVVALSDAYGTIVTFVASNTDKRWYPRVATCDASGAAINGLYEMPVLNGPVTVTVTASNALTGAVEVSLVYVTP